MTALGHFSIAAMLVMLPTADHDTARPPDTLKLCRAWTDLDAYLRKNGFVPEETWTYESGASFIRYRFLGNAMWVARWPDGRACLVPSHLMRRLDRAP